MARLYETGLRDGVIRHAMACAIRDRQELLDAWLPRNALTADQDTETRVIIEEIRAELRDFRKLAKSLLL